MPTDYRDLAMIDALLATLQHERERAERTRDDVLRVALASAQQAIRQLSGREAAAQG